MDTRSIFRIAAFATLLLAAVCVQNALAEPDGSDGGYFLSIKQKGQLIATGLIEDDAGNRYDVWIVPGYVGPAERIKSNQLQALDDFGEYFQAKKYQDLRENSLDGFDWAFNDCIMDFTIEGVPMAWSRNFSAASEQTSRQVFGWWLAYPWALMSSTVETAVRVPAGLAGAALGTAWGGAVVPAYYAVNSTAKGVWHSAVQGAALPLAQAGWNTAIAPPMALIGQKPAPSRVDGTWVTIVNEKRNLFPSSERR